jgi:hypothetical protein
MFSIIPPYFSLAKHEITNFINWDKYIKFINSFNKSYNNFDKILIKYNILSTSITEVYFLQYYNKDFIRRYEKINANIDQTIKEFEYFILI